MSDVLRLPVAPSAPRAMYVKACPRCGHREATAICSACDAFKFPAAVPSFAHELDESFRFDQPEAA